MGSSPTAASSDSASVPSPEAARASAALRRASSRFARSRAV